MRLSWIIRAHSKSDDKYSQQSQKRRRQAEEKACEDEVEVEILPQQAKECLEPGGLEQERRDSCLVLQKTRAMPIL